MQVKNIFFLSSFERKFSICNQWLFYKLYQYVHYFVLQGRVSLLHADNGEACIRFLEHSVPYLGQRKLQSFELQNDLPDRTCLDDGERDLCSQVNLFLFMITYLGIILRSMFLISPNSSSNLSKSWKMYLRYLPNRLPVFAKSLEV